MHISWHTNLQKSLSAVDSALKFSKAPGSWSSSLRPPLYYSKMRLQTSTHALLSLSVRWLWWYGHLQGNQVLT